MQYFGLFNLYSASINLSTTWQIKIWDFKLKKKGLIIVEFNILKFWSWRSSCPALLSKYHEPTYPLNTNLSSHYMNAPFAYDLIRYQNVEHQRYKINFVLPTTNWIVLFETGPRADNHSEMVPNQSCNLQSSITNTNVSTLFMF